MKLHHIAKSSKGKDASSTPKPRAPLGISRKVFLSSSLGILAVGGIFTTYIFSYAGKIPPHTEISGIPVGGLTKEQALAILTKREGAFLDQRVTLHYQAREWILTPKELQLQFQNSDAISQAFSRGKQGSIAQQSAQLFDSLFQPHYYETELGIVPDQGRKSLSDKVLASIESQPKETSLDFIPGAVRISPGVSGEKLDYSSFQARLYDAFRQGQNDIPLVLLSSNPEVSVAQAESARVQADAILSGSWSLQVGDSIQVVDVAQIAKWLTSSVLRDGTNQAIGLQVGLKEDVAKAALDTLASKINRSPLDAQIKSENGTISVLTDGRNGLKMDVDSTLAAVKSALLRSMSTTSRHFIQAVAQVVQPDVRRETISSLGIKELIGTGTTDFSGSPSNRTFNINLGQKTLNGKIVQDGQIFSTLGALGPVEYTTGYLPELSILGGKIIDAAGGGLCQVSTTLFRAVLNAGLPVTERQAHTYEVGYYERGVGPGLDATIYDPSPDFKWKNDTGHAVLVQSFIKGNNITFELYGTKDGRASTISAPQILQDIPVGPAQYADTDTLYKGQTKQIENPHNGAKTTVNYSVSRDGHEINHQVFNSFYQPLPAMFLVGTKDVPPSPSPSPTPPA
jgi:vancomycin resistance protein YoaR